MVIGRPFISWTSTDRPLCPQGLGMHGRKQDHNEKMAAVYMVGRRGQPKVNFSENQIFPLDHMNMDWRMLSRETRVERRSTKQSTCPEQTTDFRQNIFPCIPGLPQVRVLFLTLSAFPFRKSSATLPGYTRNESNRSEFFSFSKILARRPRRNPFRRTVYCLSCHSSDN